MGGRFKNFNSEIQKVITDFYIVLDLDFFHSIYSVTDIINKIEKVE